MKKEYSMQELAFIGDSIHTTFVRNWVVNNHSLKLNEYHRLASKYCNAKAQSGVLEKISPLLSFEESEIVRKARNTKTKHSAKNSSPIDYHRATAFESLIGWLYLNNKKDRLLEILGASLLGQEEKC